MDCPGMGVQVAVVATEAMSKGGLNEMDRCAAIKRMRGVRMS